MCDRSFIPSFPSCLSPFIPRTHISICMGLGTLEIELHNVRTKDKKIKSLCCSVKFCNLLETRGIRGNPKIQCRTHKCQVAVTSTAGKDLCDYGRCAVVWLTDWSHHWNRLDIWCQHILITKTAVVFELSLVRYKTVLNETEL